MVQALIALLINAAEAMPEGCHVDIKVLNSPSDPDRILIMVKDTGVGIPDDVKDKILEPLLSTKQEKRNVG